MKPHARKGNWKLVGLFAVLGAALLLSTGGKAHAQTHSFSSGGSGHLGRGSARSHRAAVRPHWGIPQHGFGYGSGYGSYWSHARGHDRFAYAPYGGLYSHRPRLYPYPLHSYPLYVYPRGHRPLYYVPGYHRPPFYGGRRFHR